MTNNFVIARNCFEQIRFEETLIQYGHEDTLFGYQLKKNNIEIKHINNPILNGEIETNEIFLEKTTQGIENLANINKIYGIDSAFADDISLLVFYSKIKKWNLAKLILLIFSLFDKPITSILKSKYNSLLLFDFYKLGIFIRFTKNI